MNASPNTLSANLDLGLLKNRQRTAWASGDYAVIGTTLQLVGEQLAEACDLRCDERVLDVAAGNGNATLAAARRGCEVTSTDYVASLLDRGAERAQCRTPGGEVPGGRRRSPAIRGRKLRRRAVDLRRDVRARPREGGVRDGCASAVRVAASAWPTGRPRVSSARCSRSWAATCRRRPGTQPPSLWGVEKHLHELFGDRAAAIAVTPRVFNFRYRSAAHFIEMFRTWYGPVHKAFASLSTDQAIALERDLAELLDGLNRAGAAALVVPSEYLEIVVTRR